MGLAANVATDTSGRPTTFVVVALNVITFGVFVLGVYTFKNQTKCLYICVII